MRLDHSSGSIVSSFSQYKSYFSSSDPDDQKYNPFTKQVTMLEKAKLVNDDTCRVVIESILMNRADQKTTNRFFILCF